MSLVDFSNVLNIFGGGEPSAEERDALFKETMLMTLSRATSSDSNIDPAEVDTVQSVLKQKIGDEVSAADIRVAAASAIYETAPLDKFLRRAGRKLTVQQCVAVTQSLADVIRSDDGVREAEVEFFNMVASSLGVSPAQLAGLIPDQP